MSDILQAPLTTKVWLGEEGNLSFCSKAKRIHRRALSGCFDAIGEHAERDGD